MRRALAVAALTGLLPLTGCLVGSGDPPVEDTFGPCRIEPGTVCRDENLSGVSLTSADLQGADLRGSRLTYATLTNANLAGANLENASLVAADLMGANLDGANLTNVTFFAANLSGASWEGAIRTGVNLCGARLPSDQLSTEGCGTDAGAIESLVFDGPPEIQRLEMGQTGCFNDVAGTSVEVVYRVRNAELLSWQIDGSQVMARARTRANPVMRGQVKVPFPCDGQPHELTFIASGQTPPGALVAPEVSQSVTLTLEPSDPATFTSG